MKSVDQKIVFRQYLTMFPKNPLVCPIFNYNNRKLTDYSLLKVFILENLFHWENLRGIETGIRSKVTIHKDLELDSISADLLSRRLETLDTALLADVFGQLAKQYWMLQNNSYSMNPIVGILKIVDATHIKLPQNASTWAAVSKDSSGVKLHLRLALASSTESFPEKAIPSTNNVADSDAVNHLIDVDGVTYVMDRGYGHKTKIGGWLERDVKFIVRVRKNFNYEILRVEYSLVSNVTKFYTVSILTRKDKLRLIEFVDADGTTFILLTNRLDLIEEEILEAYKNRWYIELFFKWLKQHVKVKHLFSHSPRGIWNQLLIALITVGLSEIMRILKNTKKTAWEFYQLICQYLLDPWEEIQEELDRKKKPSRGR